MDEPDRRPAASADTPDDNTRTADFTPGAAGTPAALGDFLEYRLLEKLGEGGMGAVYKAHHVRLGRTVAIKVLAPAVATDPQRIAHFEREMKAVGRLDHPHIVRAMDAGAIGGRHYLVMEYVEGLPLDKVVARTGPLRIADACEAARQAALGLRYADDFGLIHRDIKPSNLMLDTEGRVKVVDFGLALLEGEQSVAEKSSSGQIMGTADYIAPEQIAASRTIDIRADIYSLGCTLYKLLTGRAPFAGPEYRSTAEKLMAHLHVPVPPVCELRSDVPEGFIAILDRLLAKDRDLRLPSPARVIEALTPWAAGADLVGLYNRAARPAAAGGAAESPPSPAGSPIAVTRTPPAAAGESPGIDPYHKWLGIPPEEQPPHHYRLLGIRPFEDDREVIEAAVARQAAHLRRYQLGPHVALTARLLNEVAAAKICLLVPEKKAAYDVRLRAQLAERSPAQAALPLAPAQVPATPVPPPLEAARSGRPSYARRRRVALTALAMAGLALVAAALFLLPRATAPPIRGELVFDWPLHQRKSARLEIDGRPHSLAANEPFSVVLSPGTHRVAATRWGFEPFNASIEIQAGQRQTIAPAWRAKARLVLPGSTHDWPGLGLSIDGQPHDPAELVSASHDGSWALALEPGERVVRLWRPGFVAVERELEVGDGSDILFEPVWQQVPPGEGLPAQFYTGRDFQEWMATERHPQVQFNWGTSAPLPGMKPDDFSVRWIGWLRPPVAGCYRIACRVDDGLRIWLDGRLLIGEWHSSVGTYEADVDLTAAPHALRVEYCELTVGAEIALLWALPGVSTLETIPRAFLFAELPDAEAAHPSREALALRPLPVPSAVPVAGTPVDLIALSDPLHDTIRSLWWLDGATLCSGRDVPAVLQIPYTPPAEYRIDAVVERIAGRDALVFGLVGGGREFQVVLDGYDGKLSGVELLDGARYGLNELGWRGRLFEEGRRVPVTCTVGQDQLKVACDGRTVIDWRADYRRVRPCHEWRVPGAQFLSLGSWESAFRVYSLTLTPLSTAPQPAVDDAPGPLATVPEIRDLPADEWTDLLPYADAELDAVSGHWWRAGDEIGAASAPTARLMLRVCLMGDYELEVEFTRHAGRTDVGLILPLGIRQTYVQLSGYDGAAGGLNLVDGLSPRENSASVRPSRLENGRRYRLRAVVRRTGEDASIETFLDDQPFVSFQGRADRVSLKRPWDLPALGRPGLASHLSATTFHRVRVRGPAGAGYLLPPDRKDREPFMLTPAFGPRGGDCYFSLAPRYFRLIGIRAGEDAITPIYGDARRRQRQVGLPFGPGSGATTEIVAREGYGVGAVAFRADRGVTGVRLVFFRERGGVLDPDDSYASDWIGGREQDRELVLGGNGQPILGLYGAATDDAIGAVGLVIRQAAGLPPQEPYQPPAATLARLVDLQPRRYGQGLADFGFLARQSRHQPWHLGDAQPWVAPQVRLCDEFLLAPAPSKVVYAVPAGMRSFTAVGYCPASGRARFEVAIDGQPAAASPRAGVTPIAVELPEGAKTLTLSVDDLGDNARDFSYWLVPRLRAAPAVQFTTLAEIAAEDAGAIKLTEREPLSAEVGRGALQVNRAVRQQRMPLDPSALVECNEYLFAHAPSWLSYEIPAGATEFAAVGYCLAGAVKFRVFVDGESAATSALAGVAPMRVPLAAGAKRIDLIVDPVYTNERDYSFWCYPRFTGAKGPPSP